MKIRKLIHLGSARRETKGSDGPRLEPIVGGYMPKA